MPLSPLPGVVAGAFFEIWMKGAVSSMKNNRNRGICQCLQQVPSTPPPEKNSWLGVWVPHNVDGTHMGAVLFMRMFAGDVYCYAYNKSTFKELIT